MEKWYRNILRSSFRIVWQNKFLWFFGLFTALLGSVGEYEVILQHLDAYTFQQRAIITLIDNQATGDLTLVWNGLIDAMQANVGKTVLWAVLFLAIVVIVYALSVLSQGGLISATMRSNRGEVLTLETSWHDGRNVFWRILTLSLGTKIVIWLLFLAAGVPLGYASYTSSNNIWDVTLLLLVIFIFIPASVIVAFVARFSQGAAVMQNLTVGHAIKEGGLLFARNWVIAAEMAFVLLLVNIAAGLAIVLGIVAIAIPFLVFGLFMTVLGATAIFNAITILGMIVIGIWILAFGSMVSAFQWTAWMTLFELLNQGKVKSKLSRVIDRLPDYLGRKRIEA